MALTFKNNIMERSKEYFLKLSEEIYTDLPNDEKIYLNRLGMEVRQLPTKDDLNDDNYKKIKKNRIDAWNEEQKYLFEKRQK